MRLFIWPKGSRIRRQPLSYYFNDNVRASTLNPNPLFRDHASQQLKASSNPTLWRSFHATPPTSGFIRDILSSLRDDGQAQAASRLEQKKQTEQYTLLRELDQAGWIHHKLEQILREGHPDRILHALQHDEWGSNFMRYASPTLFEGVLRLIPPTHFLSPYLSNDFQFVPNRHNTLPKGIRGRRVRSRPDTPQVQGSYRVYANVHLRFDNFSSQVNNLLERRSRAGHALGLPEYRYLLDLSRTTADGELADSVWDVMVQSVQPDQECYDWFLEAKVWAGLYDFYEHDRMTVTPRIHSIRQMTERPPGFTGHRTGPHGLRTDTVLRLDEMVSKGFSGTETTFACMITAMGRDMDLAGVKNVLRSVWNIDLDLLLEVGEEELETTPLHHEWTSSLRPTSKLLFTLAHVFSINGEPLLGLTAVDFVSRQYDLEIPYEVWIELLTAVFRRANLRTRSMSPENDRKLPPAAFQDLWNVMTDAPHNVIPDERMHLIRTKMYLRTGRKDETIDSLRFLQDMFDDTRTRFEAFLYDFVDHCKAVTESPDFIEDSYILPASWFDLRNKVVESSVHLEAVLHVLLFCANKALQSRVVSNLDFLSWDREGLPDAMRLLYTCLHGDLRIKMETGSATFHLGNGTNKRRNGYRVGWINSRLGLLRLGTDTRSHQELMVNAHAIAQNAMAFEVLCLNCGNVGHARSICPHDKILRIGSKFRQLERHSETRQMLAAKLKVIFSQTAQYRVDELDNVAEPEETIL